MWGFWEGEWESFCVVGSLFFAREIGDCAVMTELLVRYVKWLVTLEFDNLTWRNVDFRDNYNNLSNSIFSRII